MLASHRPIGLQSLISTIFTFALDEDLVSAHPCARLKKRGEEKPRDRELRDAEIRLFWHRIVQSPVSRPTGLALRLALCPFFLIASRRPRIRRWRVL